MPLEKPELVRRTLTMFILIEVARVGPGGHTVTPGTFEFGLDVELDETARSRCVSRGQQACPITEPVCWVPPTGPWKGLLVLLESKPTLWLSGVIFASYPYCAQIAHTDRCG